MALGPGTSDITPSLVNPPRIPARTATVRRQFDQRVPRVMAHDFLLREIGRRLFARLDLMKLVPQAIADVGCGAGASREAFATKYPQAQWLGIDQSLAMLAAGRPAGLRATVNRWFGQSPALIGAEAGALPLADASVDLVHSNLMLHWHPEPHRLFPEWKRVLRTDGLLLFSCFGPDTLKELRAAMLEVEPRVRPMSFVDMHDFGDMMVAAGLATPVMDVETIRLTYASARELIAEVRGLGANPRDDRWASLISGRRARALVEALERRRDADGRITLSFEVAYGHAWKPVPRAVANTVSLDRLREKIAAPR
ncbi:MAG: methyltransferase domain-containing protein [Burkholderiaceae bacterium]